MVRHSLLPCLGKLTLLHFLFVFLNCCLFQEVISAAGLGSVQLVVKLFLRLSFRLFAFLKDLRCACILHSGQIHLLDCIELRLCFDHLLARNAENFVLLLRFDYPGK